VRAACGGAVAAAGRANRLIQTIQTAIAAEKLFIAFS
jgi:hypothetical protein